MERLHDIPLFKQKKKTIIHYTQVHSELLTFLIFSLYKIYNCAHCYIVNVNLRTFLCTELLDRPLVSIEKQKTLF